MKDNKISPSPSETHNTSYGRCHTISNYLYGIQREQKKNPTDEEFLRFSRSFA